MEDPPETEIYSEGTCAIRLWPVSPTIHNMQTLVTCWRHSPGVSNPAWRRKHVFKVSHYPGGNVVVINSFLWHNGHTLQNFLITHHSRFLFAKTTESKTTPYLPWRPSWGGDCWCPGGFCTPAPRCCRFGHGCLWGWFQREDCSTGQCTRHLSMSKNYWVNAYFYPLLISLSFTLDSWATGFYTIPPDKLRILDSRPGCQDAGKEQETFSWQRSLNMTVLFFFK